VLPTLVDYFPPQFKVELTASELKYQIKRQINNGKVDYTREPLVNKSVQVRANKPGARVAFCLGWEALFGKIHSKYYLEANITVFGRYGAKLDLIDSIVR
jgi:hypothetical protein